MDIGLSQKKVIMNGNVLLVDMVYQTTELPIVMIAEQKWTKWKMRPIDADKLKDIISDTWILDRIDEQPIVDPYKHGHWIIHREGKWFSNHDLESAQYAATFWTSMV